MTRRWPLLLLALPAFVAVWSGWVRLGELCGFGVVKPLPGILDDVTINTAITLPVGVETYAAYALGAWLSGRWLSSGTRAFAKWSAIGSLALGMAGQVAYHLLVTFELKTTPWQIVTAVSCLPVLVLGMGVGLGHMLARDAHAVPATEENSSVEAGAEAVPAGVPNGTPEPEAAPAGVQSRTPEPSEYVPEPPQVPVSQEVYDWAREVELFDSPMREGDRESARTGEDSPVVPDGTPEPEPVHTAAEYVPGDVPEDLRRKAASRFLANVVTGDVPGVRQLKTELNIGQDKAQQVRAYLATLAAQ
jgi:hypothetical protein